MYQIFAAFRAEPVQSEEANAPRFIVKLQPQHAPDGATVQLECRVEGNPKPQITWFRETAIIKPSTDFQVSAIIKQNYSVKNLFPEPLPSNKTTL